MLEIFAGLGVSMIVLFVTMLVWSIIWKGFALWIAVKENKKYWFIAILIVNTFGILEIIYIFLFSENGKRYLAKFKNHVTTTK